MPRSKTNLKHSKRAKAAKNKSRRIRGCTKKRKRGGVATNTMPKAAKRCGGDSFIRFWDSENNIEKYKNTDTGDIMEGVPKKEEHHIIGDEGTKQMVLDINSNAYYFQDNTTTGWDWISPSTEPMQHDSPVGYIQYFENCIVSGSSSDGKVKIWNGQVNDFTYPSSIKSNIYSMKFDSKNVAFCVCSKNGNEIKIERVIYNASQKEIRSPHTHIYTHENNINTLATTDDGVNTVLSDDSNNLYFHFHSRMSQSTVAKKFVKNEISKSDFTFDESIKCMCMDIKYIYQSKNGGYGGYIAVGYTNGTVEVLIHTNAPVADGIDYEDPPRLKSIFKTAVENEINGVRRVSINEHSGSICVVAASDTQLKSWRLTKKKSQGGGKGLLGIIFQQAATGAGASAMKAASRAVGETGNTGKSKEDQSTFMSNGNEDQSNEDQSTEDQSTEDQSTEYVWEEQLLLDKKMPKTIENVALYNCDKVAFVAHNSIYVYNNNSSTLLTRVPCINCNVIAFSPCGNFIVSGGTDGKIQKFNCENKWN